MKDKVRILSRAGRAALRLSAYFSKIVASRVLAHIFQKYFAHSWFRVFAHCICFFTSPFFRAPSSFGPLSRPLAGGCPTLSPIRPLSHHPLGKTPSRRMRENVRICPDLIYPLIPVVGMPNLFLYINKPG